MISVPQRARRHDLEGGAGEGELPGRVLLHRLHEGVGDQDGEVEHAQPSGIALGVDEGLDIGMVAAQGRHHRAAAVAGAHDGAAHGIPDIHERERPRGVGADALDRRALGAQAGEIVADAAALLHGERRLAQMGEDAGHVVRDGAHDEAIEERDAARAAGAGDHPAGGQELEPGHGLVEALRPERLVRLGLGERIRHPPPGILDGLVHRVPVRPFEPVLHVPDLLRDRGDGCHLDDPRLIADVRYP